MAKLLLFFNFSGLKGRIMLSTVVISLLLLFVGGIGVYTVRQVINSYSRVAEVYQPIVQRLTGLLAESREVVVVVTMITSVSQDADLVNTLNTQYDEAVGNFNLERDELKILLEQINQTEAFDDLMLKWKRVTKLSNDMMALSFSANGDDQKKFKELLQVDFSSARKGFFESIEKLIKDQKVASLTAQTETAALVKKGNITVAVAVLGGFILALFLGYMVSSILTKKLLEVSSQLSMGAGEVTAAAGKVQGVSEKLSISTTQQASSMEETSSSTQRLNDMVIKNAEASANSKKVSQEGRREVDRGKEVVSLLARKMEEISESNFDIASQVEVSNQALKNIVSVIKEIGTKTQVINDIVFQTKLLSFNAAVEAARAGEHGKGFAVVADEIGNLAQMSGEAAKVITAMLAESTSQVERIVSESRQKVTSLIDLGSQKIEEGVLAAKDSEKLLERVSSSIAEIDVMASEISNSSADQARGLGEIAAAINELGALTQDSVLITGEAAGSAQELFTSAQGLSSAAQTLLETVLGKSRAKAQIKADYSRESENNDEDFSSKWAS